MSAFQDRVIRVVWMGVDEVTPTLNRINGSITNSARMSQQWGQSMGGAVGLLERQWRTLGHTLRYAVSGFALYKVFGALQQYKEYRSELGQLNANLLTTAQNLNALGGAAIKVSQQTATPLNDVLQSFQNIAASFPGINQQLIPGFSAIEAKGSRVLQVEPRLFGQTIGRIASQFYGRDVLLNPKTAEPTLTSIADQLVRTRFRLHGVTGQDLINYLSNVTGAAAIGGLTLPQTLSAYTVAQQSVGNPSQTASYMRQLLIRLKSRPTAAARPLFAQAGITRADQANQSSMQILDRLIEHALGLGGANMTFAEAKRSGYKTLEVHGRAAQFIQDAIGGRQQSLLATMAIIRGFGQMSVETQKRMGDASDDLNKRWQAWLDNNKFTQASIAFSDMTTSMLDDLNPLFAGVADITAKFAGLATGANTGLKAGAGIINKDLFGSLGAGNFASKHHLGGIAEIGALVGGGLLARAGIKSLGGFLSRGGMGRLGGWLGGAESAATGAGGIGGITAKIGTGAGALVRAPLDVQAITSALSGTANGSPSAPFWVVIHPLSQQTVPWMGKKGSQNIEATLEKWAKKTGEGAAAAEAGARVAGKSLFGRVISGAARGVGRAGGAAARGILGPDIVGGAETTLGSTGLKVLGPAGMVASILANPDTAGSVAIPKESGMTRIDTGGGRWINVPSNSYLVRFINLVKTRTGGQIYPRPIQDVMTQFGQGKITEAAAEQNIARLLQQNPQFLASLAPPSPRRTTPIFKPRGNRFATPGYGTFHTGQGYGTFPHHQYGGMIGYDGLSVVGENGPELSYFRRGTSIGSNNVLENLNRYLTIATSRPAAGGTMVMGSVDATFNLEPTQELKDLIKPQKIRASVPTRFWQDGAPPPTSRGQSKVARNT